MPGDFLEIKGAALFAKLTMENNLKQQVPQLFNQFMVVARFDCIQELIDLLDGMPTERLMVLLAVPGAASRGPEARHHPQQVLNGRRRLYHLTKRPGCPGGPL